MVTAVKDVRVTESYLSLGEEMTGCQTGEVRYDCLTRRHRDQVLTSCHCAPANLRSYYGQEVTSHVPRDLLSSKVGEPLLAMRCIFNLLTFNGTTR